MSRLEEIKGDWAACSFLDQFDTDSVDWLISEAEKVAGLEADIERWRGRQATDAERIVELEAEVKRLREQPKAGAAHLLHDLFECPPENRLRAILLSANLKMFLCDLAEVEEATISEAK